MTPLSFKLNGQPIQAANVEPHTTLLNWLRQQGLTGSKEGCAEGECGACAVLLVHDHLEGGARYVPANGCLLLVHALHGQEVITVEGLGTPVNLHPVQEAMASNGSSQCGYCTPGFVISMAGEYYRQNRQDFQLEAIHGNLCRCTGYRPIRDAALTLGQPAPNDPLAARLAEAAPRAESFHTRHGEREFHRPASLTEVFDLLDARADATLVAGGTDWVVDVNQRAARTDVQISIDRVAELREFHAGGDHVLIGAGLTLSEVEERLAGRVPLLSQLFPLFASVLIRNRATLGGNIGTASPIGDSPPVLLALGADVVLTSRSGDRSVPLDAFFTGYRQTVRQSGEVIRAVRVPVPVMNTARFYKVAKRPMDDISTVAAAFAVEVQGGVVQAARIAFGGVAATPVRAYRTEEALVGQPWDEGTLRRATQVISGEFSPISDHRGSAEYRRAMLPRLLEKFFRDTRAEEVTV